MERNGKYRRNDDPAPIPVTESWKFVYHVDRGTFHDDTVQENKRLHELQEACRPRLSLFQAVLESSCQ